MPTTELRLDAETNGTTGEVLLILDDRSKDLFTVASGPQHAGDQQMLTGDSVISSQPPSSARDWSDLLRTIRL